MKIGELASATGVQIPTIRFYEQEGCYAGGAHGRQLQVL